MEEMVIRTEAMPRKSVISRRRGCGLAVTKKAEQKLMGIVLLLVCAVVTLADEDATVVLLLAPLGLWMLFAKDIVIY